MGNSREVKEELVVRDAKTGKVIFEFPDKESRDSFVEILDKMKRK